MTDLNEIASKHLGRASDGSLVMPYVTPEEIDPELLVGVPRHLNRTVYEIDETQLPFVGFDTWHCYEFSTLLNSGFPLAGMMKIVYSSDTPNIVESKSLKLYLNSFNMVRMGQTKNEVINNVVDRVQNDLKKCIGGSVYVHLFQHEVPRAVEMFEFDNIDDLVDVTEGPFDRYNEDPKILMPYMSEDNQIIQWKSNALRSNCRITNQPDWGDVFLYMNGKAVPTMKSFLQYIVSMRKENHFHEEICECIYKRLWDLYKPNELFVACLYTRRGGIDINPIRASSDELLRTFASALRTPYYTGERTLRQ